MGRDGYVAPGRPPGALLGSWRRQGPAGAGALSWSGLLRIWSMPKLMGSCGCGVCALADASILGRRKGLGWAGQGRRLGPRYGAAMERPAPLVALKLCQECAGPTGSVSSFLNRTWSFRC